MQVLRNIHCDRDVLPAQLLLLPTRQQPSNLENILNLASIQVHPRQLHKLRLINSMFLRTRIQKVLPYRLARVDGETGVVERDVDAGLECWIESLNTVGCEKHGTFVVFQYAQEDGNEFVALEFVQRTLLEEDVGFVEKENGIPAASHFENVLELALHFAGVETEVAGAHHVEGNLHFFGYGLRGEGLADAWGTAEQDNHAFPFSFDYVVKGVTEFALGFCEA